MLRPVSSSRILRFDFRWRSLEEELAEHLGSTLFRRDGHAGSGPGQTATAVHRERERRKPSLNADVFGDVLVQRDGVAEGTAGRMRRGGEKTHVGRMPAIHVGMRNAAENCEVIAMFLQQLEIRRRRIIAALTSREEVCGQHAKIVADARTSGAASRWASAAKSICRAREWREHRVEERQRQSDAGTAEKVAARHRLARVDEGTWFMRW